MARFAFIIAALIACSAALPARAQTPAADAAPQATQPSEDEVGNVTTVQGNAAATRNGTSRRLKVKDPIFKGDLLRTAAAATLSITFDDETTFNLSANASITIDEFIYHEGGQTNSALFKIARGTLAFAAHQVAKTGDMKIETPSSVLGIRGTSGVVDVPEGTTPGSTGEVAVKLYADQDGRVGRIELFGSGGGPSLGLLTRAATGFALRPGAGGRFAAVALTISPQQMARDRGFVQRAFQARSIGRPMIDQRRNLRTPGGFQRQGQPGLRQPGQPGQRQQQNRPGTRQPSQGQPGLRQQGQPGQPGTRQPASPRQGALPSQRPAGAQNAPAVQGQPGSGSTAPNAQNPQRPNLQRQNLQKPATTPAAPRQPARRKPSGNAPPPR